MSEWQVALQLSVGFMNTSECGYHAWAKADFPPSCRMQTALIARSVIHNFSNFLIIIPIDDEFFLPIRIIRVSTAIVKKMMMQQ